MKTTRLKASKCRAKVTGSQESTAVNVLRLCRHTGVNRRTHDTRKCILSKEKKSEESTLPPHECGRNSFLLGRSLGGVGEKNDSGV